MPVFWTRKSEVDPKLLLEGKIEGKRGQVGETTNYLVMKNIKEWLGHTHNGCVRRAEDPGDP